MIFRLRFRVRGTLYDLVGACTLTGVYNHYSEVHAGIVARLVEMIPHRMIFQLGVC